MKNPPSTHLRAFITWLAIFPLVSIAMVLTGAFTADWHPVLKALLLSVIVVPLAVYLVVPQLFRMYGAFLRRRTAKRVAL